MPSLAFDAADLARTRFAISPMRELVWSLVALRKPDQRWLHRPWRARALAALDSADVGLLRAMAGGRRYLPDFLTPTPRTSRPSFEDELTAILATPVRRVVEQVRRVHPDRPAPPALIELLADPVAGLSRLADQISWYFERVLAPQWPPLRAAAEAEITHRLELAAEHGLRSVLIDLHPDLSWDGARLRVALGCPDTLDGAALMLVPTAFAWPHTHPATEATVDGWVVHFPPRGVGNLWSAGAPRTPRSLTALLGATRAAVLAAAARPRTTTELANLLGVSPPTVSHHLAALRANGLVVGHRDGRTVRYRRTALGDQLSG